ncbi:hypothetical protein HU200_049033 [Digitaria exilis]|uniref:Disease resistance R13L4/SHOC-2-like LRR domain-containing protein n=1 Tax=Digitaria exilis TaxID=1010633 RepID=A0A835E742_9POAL|nr:hypothetical protein HU200_049033 [Digitaria exilis]
MSAHQGNSTSCTVEEEILAPLLARLTTMSTLIESSAALPPPPPNGPATTHNNAGAGDDGTKVQARELLAKVRREVVQLQAVFRRIDDAEKRIRYSFDPLEHHLDDALQLQLQLQLDGDDPHPLDALRIHTSLLDVHACVEAIKAAIRDTYNDLPCGVTAGDPVVAGGPPTQLTAGVVMTEKMSDVRRGPQMSHLSIAVAGLVERLRSCALCLAAFPEGAVVKKRLLLHWWMAEGFVRSADDGKSRFDELVARGFIIPAAGPGPTTAAAPLCGTVHRCTVRLWMRDLLAGVAKRKGFLELGNAGDVAFARRACLRGGGGGGGKHPAVVGFSAGVRAIYNIGHKYVELDEKWFPGKGDLRVLQLGQWRKFTTRDQIANPMDSHIEVSGVDRLRDMGRSCKNLRYMSFRGISRIESLPDSIGKLQELQVLDLRACHNLEHLGKGITKLDRLEYLDLSECHLLVGVPKGLGQLTRLQILKGFVVANSNSRDLCHLNELTKLDKLRKLGVVIGKMAMPNDDEFIKLAQFKALESLKISWGVLNNLSAKSGRPCMETIKYALPPNLKKLELHCFPFADFEQWVQPTGVRKLYIRGGRLTTFGDGKEGWEAEVLRLRFLSDLRCDFDRFQRLFTKLKPENTEIHECPNFIHRLSDDVGEK